MSRLETVYLGHPNRWRSCHRTLQSYIPTPKNSNRKFHTNRARLDGERCRDFQTGVCKTTQCQTRQCQTRQCQTGQCQTRQYHTTVPNETVPKKTVTNKRDVPNGTVCYSIGEEVVKVFIINSRDDEEAVLKS
jgi:hypothetical protein